MLYRMGNKIREAREAAQLSQTQLAERAKIPQGSLSRLETSTEPKKVKTLRKIAKVLGTDWWRLV